MDLRHADLGFHPSAPTNVYEPGKARRFPAMVARLTNTDGELTGVQCLYLSRGGTAKAPMDCPRLSFGKVMGSLCYLGNVRDACVIGEGIETTLSAGEACGLPGVAAIGSANLAEAMIPQRVRRVLIAYDRDAKGQGKRAADRLALRLWSEDRDVAFLPPPEPFCDWNDAAMAGALPKREEA